MLQFLQINLAAQIPFVHLLSALVLWTFVKTIQNHRELRWTFRILFSEANNNHQNPPNSLSNWRQRDEMLYFYMQPTTAIKVSIMVRLLSCFIVWYRLISTGMCIWWYSTKHIFCASDNGHLNKTETAVAEVDFTPPNPSRFHVLLHHARCEAMLFLLSHSAKNHKDCE